MDRYTIGFLILVGWFVCFRMFPADFRADHPPKPEFMDVVMYPDPDDPRVHFVGKDLFNTHCSSCHDLHRAKQHNFFPGVATRMPGGDWIYDWIHDSQKLIQSGDAYAHKIWEENGKVTMPAFPQLSRPEIDSIMRWINAF
jgi:Cytochrome c